ncbi:MAG: hypothetical protein LKF71_07940 [Oscillospiraceae bacterium]|jgi:hypothetical protein|nr:hypothetical protein [Oscillospiraceae bacterium]
MKTPYEQSVYDRAAKKIQRIIAREGAADGQRLQPWYLAEIEDEIRQADKVSALTMLANQSEPDSLPDVS